MLERNGLKVLDAGDAKQGLALLTQHDEIRAAIIDMVLPGMSGLDLAAEMGRCHPGIDILYISGYVGSIAIQAIADRNRDAVLLKPFTEQRLVARVRSMLGIPGEPSPDAEPASMTVGTAWERLIEASDSVGHPYRIAAYRNTTAAYSIAAAHTAVLREASVPYQFRMHDDPVYPFELLAPAEDWRHARDAIATLGLSADIELAA